MVKGEARGSKASKKQSVSSISAQAPSSKTHSYAYESTDKEKLQVTVGTGYRSRHYDMQQYEERLSTNASGNGYYTNQRHGEQVRIGASEYGHYSKYAAQVTAGAVSLGIDASPALQLALADQHGSFRAREPTYSTVKEGEQFLGDSQGQDFGDVEVSLQREPCAAFGYESGGLSGDFIGIGTQFDSQVGYSKYL